MLEDWRELFSLFINILMKCFVDFSSCLLALCSLYSQNNHSGYIICTTFANAKMAKNFLFIRIYISRVIIDLHHMLYIFLLSLGLLSHKTSWFHELLLVESLNKLLSMEACLFEKKKRFRLYFFYFIAENQNYEM